MDDTPAYLINHGKAHLNDGHAHEALPLLERAVHLYPQEFLAQNYLADAYYLTQQPAKAIQHYENALRLRPSDVDVITNLSVCHWQLADFATAHAYAKQVREEKPVNYGLMALMVGDYAEGWRYWDFLDTASSLDLPSWQGEPIAGKRIIVLDEDQGFGDTLLMARFLPALIERNAIVTFQTRAPLRRLMEISFPTIEIVEQVAGSFDLSVRLFSLPRLLEITPETLPNAPYLRPDQSDVRRWTDVLAQEPGRKVGLRWSGSPGYSMDHLRSIGDLSLLTPLGSVTDVTYVSLAKEPGLQPDLPLLQYELTDFADTAALIQALDGVISIDTGIINLAGALGKSAWLMNYYGYDWRWHKAWYPSVRQFRQRAFGDWGSVVDEIRMALLMPINIVPR